MNNYAKQIESAQRYVIKQTSWTETREILWGNADGQFVVLNPVYPREVYWHSLSTEEQEVGIAILDPDCNILYQENANYAANPPRIIIGKPPKSELWHVQGVSKSLEGAQTQGSLSPIEQLSQLVGNPSIFNVLDLRVRPTDTPSTSVFVEAGMYEKPSAPGVKQKWLGGTLDLATLIAALTSGQHQLAVIILDTEAGTLTYSTTTAVSAVGALPSRLELTSISSITFSAGQEAVGTVYLYEGQTTIEQADWIQSLDPRLTWPPLNDASTGLTNPLTSDLDAAGFEIQNYTEESLTTSQSSGYAVDWESANLFEITLTGNVTLTFSNLAAGRSITIILEQDGTGGRTITFPGSTQWAGGTVPTLTTAANAVDVYTFMVRADGTTVLGFVAGQDMQ